jgi:hypothetical protein
VTRVFVRVAVVSPDMGLPYPLFLRLELRCTRAGVPYEVTASHPDTCSHFRRSRTHAEEVDGDAPPVQPSATPDHWLPPALTSMMSHASSDAGIDASHTPVVDTTASTPVATPLSSSQASPVASAPSSHSASMCKSISIADGIFSAISTAAVEMGGRVDDATCSGKAQQSSKFSSMFLRRAHAGKDVSDVDGGASAERLVLRVVAMTLPNIAFDIEGVSRDDCDVQERCAVMPFRFVVRVWSCVVSWRCLMLMLRSLGAVSLWRCGKCSRSSARCSRP